MNLGRKIKYEREKMSLSQEQLADIMHITRQAISKWETGQSYPDIEKLLQLAELFQLSLDDLVRDDNALKNKLIKDGKQHMNGFTIIACVLIASGVLTVLWGGSLYPINIMDSNFMSFLIGGFIIILAGICLFPQRPVWLAAGTLWITVIAVVVYLIGFKMELFVTLISIVMVLGIGAWLTLFITKQL